MGTSSNATLLNKEISREEVSSKLCKRELPKKNDAIVDSLIAIALALPGVSAAKAQDSISTSPQMETFYSTYSENKNHYKIDSYEGSVLFPLSSNFEFGLSITRDAMTGASTVGYFPHIIAPVGIVIPGTSVDPNYFLTEVRTGASIIETRNDAQLIANYYFPKSKLSGKAGYSTEHDYQSFYANLNTEWYFNKKNTILYTGIGYAFNISQPSNTSFSGPILHNSGTSNTESILVGLKQDINKNFVVQQNVELIIDNGFLSDPYKRIAFNGPNTVNWPGAELSGPNIFVGYERRPSARVTGAFGTQLVHYVPYLDSSIHFNYRFALNNWNLRSNTFEFGYYQPLFKSWEIAPKVRYYSQNRARFYALSFHTTPTPFFLQSKPLKRGGAASSDYRLANFGVIGWDITVTKTFTDPNISLSATFGLANRSTGYSMTRNRGAKNPDNQFQSKYVTIQLNSDLPSKPSYKRKEKSNSVYQAGDIVIQPISIAFSGLSFGRRKVDTKFTSPQSSPFITALDAYKSQRGFGFNDTQRNGIGYDFQVGYFPLDFLELFVDLGVLNEKPVSTPIIAMANAYKFNTRTTYRTDIGGKYYFNTETAFSPFTGIMAGTEWQPETRSDVYYANHITQVVGPKIGKFKIFKSQNLFNGALLAGIDYRFNTNISVSFQTGLYYYQRNKSKKLRLSNDTVNISDNKNKFIVPFNISLRIIL